MAIVNPWEKEGNSEHTYAIGDVVCRAPFNSEDDEPKVFYTYQGGDANTESNWTLNGE
jgi:hypothetical protein